MVQLPGHGFHHFRLVVDYLQVQRFHTPGVFLAKFEASTVLFSEKDPCFGVVEDNQHADLVVERIGYGQFSGVPKTMLMNWKTMYIEKKQVLPDVLWKPSVVLHILSRDKYDITTKIWCFWTSFSRTPSSRRSFVEIPSVTRGPHPS